MPWLRRDAPPTPLSVAWQASVPGYHHHVVSTDAASGSVYVGDGWGVSRPSLRLQRLRADTGAVTASLRTRQQAVNSLRGSGTTLWAGTDRRLFELDASDLSIVRQWDKGLIEFPHQLFVLDGRVVMANWLKPSVGVFDPETGTTRRLRIGAQPVLLAGPEGLLAVSSVEGSLSNVQVRPPKAVSAGEVTPVTAGAWCQGFWGVAAGRRRVDRQGSSPLVERHPTRTVVRLDGKGPDISTSDRCEALYADQSRGLLWAAAVDEPLLTCIDVEAGAVRGRFSVAEGSDVLHVDPLLGLAFAAQGASDEPPLATLTAYGLPS